MEREKFMVVARLKSGEEILVFKVDDTRAVAEQLATLIRDAMKDKTLADCFVRAVRTDASPTNDQQDKEG
jgi:hypothetical protein